MSTILQAVLALCLLVSANLARAQDLGPEQLIQSITDDVMAALSTDKELAAGDKDKAGNGKQRKVNRFHSVVFLTSENAAAIRLTK